ncbi:NACHT domain- and WD repeat-containing protein 1-like isoform X3 [Portunus trituberculatus]|uniref:NACHT domain- and WD repeat-containing protein 1-like isoform X3 n=1 Tax=Portunus trituberculatus TaxID=210409 RepID=UPI001E1CFC3A|nr:NACHT domain- and WD repeat-containing protein 1-like isoform X3 [Portunus trituberculatus]
MGSSCSSSQSLKDNVSVKSEDRTSSQHPRAITPVPVRAVSSSTSDRSYDTDSCLSEKGGGANRQTSRPLLSVKIPDNDGSSLSGETHGMTQGEAPGPADVKESPRKTRGVIPHLSHLPDLNKLSDVIRNLVMGNVVYVKPILKPRKICIYTCADLKDTIMERSALMEYVYPKLRLYCMEKGYELNTVDLHWGIPDEHLNDHSLKELCLGQLTTQARDSHIVTVVFLNETFGNALLPRVIEGPDFDQGISSLEVDTDRELFWKWYHWDENAQPPCYKLQPISTFFPNIKDGNSAQHQEAVADWSAEVKKMMTLMRTVFNQEQKEKYLSTVMEQEIKQSVFMNQESAKHCLWICRKFTHFPSHNIPAQGKVYVAVEPESKKRLDILQSELKERLDEIRMLKFRVKWHNSGMNPEVPEHAQFVEDLCAQISPLLISIIDGIIEEDETKEELKTYLGIEKRLFHELMQQSLMCQFRYKNFQGRQDLLAKIRRYLNNDSCVPLIMHGEVGCGKSSLIAKAMERCCEWLVDVPLVVRFVGLTPGSSTAEQVLRSIAEQCCALFGEHPAEAAKGVRHMSSFLMHVWSKACKVRPLVIMIDGIDQVKSYGSTSLEWVPRELPENVKLIMTVRDDSEQMRLLQSIIEDRACFLKIPPMTLDEGYSKFEGILKAHHRSVNKEQRDLVSKYIQECPLPLYVEILGRMACHWTGAESQLPLKSTLMEQISMVFDELEETYGKVEVSHTLGYLTAAKHGLSDSEMIDILSCDEAVLEKVFVHYIPPVRRCPSLLWVQISKQLQPFLMKTIVAGICLFTWRHESFRDAARARYLDTPDQINMCCTALIDYFQSKWANGVKKPMTGSEEGTEEGKERYVLDQPTKYRGSNMSKISVQPVFSRHNRRKLDELPYQVLQLRGRILEEFVLNFDWVYEKLCGSDTYQVLEDVSLALTNHANNIELVLLKEVLELAAYALGYDGRQFYSQVYGRLATLMKEPKNHETYPIIHKLYDRAAHAPVPCLLPLTVCLHEPFQDQNMKLGDGQVYFNALIRARHNPHYVITLSTERGEIAVWNIFTMTPVRTLTGITQPRKLKMIDDYRCLVLCGRELRIYNFDEGLFVMKLREVMNQKMPYFGLHDKDHVVALSRSRMYVNMMNLQNGDCVATFKVGEDRFLNSLMVSENGKICVCGDETQKPSALLVWDLELRKLMYDLRIPHHEFITRHAAITKEGHYVSCVCREVDEPAPNFIVVYDLQSGTLFKKWKPGVNIISIAISSAGSCVIVGLEDSKLMAYDLITGNPRWTLKGHTAPPTTIRLDNRGLQCLTYDALGRDRSVRVWDIHTGNSLAVLTPDQAITACEISSDGKAVVMALEGRNEIVTFLLCHQKGVDGHASPKSYGNDTNRGKVFDLSQAGTWPMSGDTEENMLWS